MTVQWTLIAYFLYAEIAFLILLMLPFIPPTLWLRLFDSKLVRYIERRFIVLYVAFGGILVLLFIEAIRLTMKYGTVELPIQDRYAKPQGDTQIHLVTFRAERNLLLSGFTLFLYLVCRRMVQMLKCEAHLMLLQGPNFKRKSSDSDGTRNLLKQANIELDALQETITELRKELSEVKMEKRAEDVQLKKDE